jgi:peptidoglycan-associated lipoprotein
MNTRSVLMLAAGAVVVIAMLAGCASKGYVNKTMAEERAKNEAAVTGLQQEVDSTQMMVTRLQSLTAQLDKKADLAINEAKGFENYKVIWEGEIFFEFNSEEITTVAREVLDQCGNKMIEYRSSILEIAGYTDPIGSTGYNLELGNRRATAAKYYLVDDYGINLYRIYLVSHGARKAVAAMADGKTGAYAKQRHATLKLWGKAATE